MFHGNRAASSKLTKLLRFRTAPASMKYDKIVPNMAPIFALQGITPTALSTTLSYLSSRLRLSFGETKATTALAP